MAGIEEQVREMLKKFQEGYTKRDISLADDYMKELFDQKEDIVILGTSDGELCLGMEEAKSLIESDWKYWGDVAINFKDPKVSFNNDAAWFVTKGTVKYIFKSTEEKYESYLTFVKNHFSEDSDEWKMPPKMKLSHINWVLSHFMSDRTENEREYYWEFYLTGILKYSEQKWSIKELQFAIPVTSRYPDARVDSIEEYVNNHEEQYNKRKKYLEVHSADYSEEIKDIVDGFYKEISSNRFDDSFTEKYFAEKDDICVISTKGILSTGLEGVNSALNFQRCQWKNVFFDSSELMVLGTSDTAWVIGDGLGMNVISEEEAVSRQINDTCKLLNQNLPVKEKLFKIRRDIALMLKETSRGSQYKWPFRFMAIMIREKGKWKFHTMQFSYPFYYLLEGKTDAVYKEEGN